MMPRSLLLIALSLCSTRAVRALDILMTNDDGWASANIRAQFEVFDEAGFKLILSSPAENNSGMGSLDFPPTTLDKPCEFDTCPAGSPATGFNASDVRLNYVNSFPVTSVSFGLVTLSPKLFSKAPDLVVSGPNVGSNLGLINQFSGTVGAASHASSVGVPAIAVSADDSDQVSFTTLNSSSPSFVWAQLTLQLVNALTASSAPFLPNNTILNVNYPSTTACPNLLSKPKFVLSRVNIAIPDITSDDVATCGPVARLPTESEVLAAGQCAISVSPMDSSTKLTASKDEQAAVLARLGSFLGCL